MKGPILRMNQNSIATKVPAMSGRFSRPALLVLFTISLAWTLLGVLFIVGPEAETSVSIVLATVAVTAILLTMLLARRYAGFLRLPASVGFLAFAGRLIASLIAVAVVVAVIAGLYAYFFEYTPDATNPQSGLEIIWAVMFYPTILTPLLALILAWYLCLGASRRTPL